MTATERATQPSTAGIAVWRRRTDRADGPSDLAAAESSPVAATDVGAAVEVLIVHPGGPFWAGKDDHAWSIPKGEFDPARENAVDAAVREFVEELAQTVPAGELVPLEPFRAGKKQLYTFAVEGDIDASAITADDVDRSMVEMIWPPRSGQTVQFPEVDRAQWIELGELASKLHKGQAPLVAKLRTLLTDLDLGTPDTRARPG